LSGRWAVVGYWRKWRGTTAGGPPRVSNSEIGWSWIGAFLGVGAVAWVSSGLLDTIGTSLMIGSFGASAVLLYGAPRSPLAQPRNLVGGHVISALIGVACWKLAGEMPGLAQALAVATAIAVMHLTRTLHPPGGATALIAALGTSDIEQLGFFFAAIPVALGASILLLVALVVNNLPKSRRYPEIWW
ncbi:MAG TPA: HPP family protein, partial [Rhodocyclaceae bacterium]